MLCKTKCPKGRSKEVLMAHYVSLLRGINIGPHKRMRMPDVVQLYTQLGLTAVQTYLQSGNVLFDAPDNAHPPPQLAQQIEQAIVAQYGFEVAVLVLSIAELQHIAQQMPYAPEPAVGADRLLLSFLWHEPTAAQAQTIDPAAHLPNTYQLTGRCVYLRCPNGYSKTELTNSFFERKLKTTATTRNLNTVVQLLRLAAE